MATPAEAARYSAANGDLTARIRRDLRQAWHALGASSPQERRDVLLDIVPSLVMQYGEVGATIAAEYYEQMTGEAPGLIAAPDPDAAAGSVRALAGGLYTGRAEEAMTLIEGAAVRHMLQAGRSTIFGSARRSKRVRFARVPEPGACDWCRIMSSRGAVYLSRQSAGGEGNDWHDGCGCSPIAIRDGDELPYDADALYDEYKPAWDAAGGHGVQAGAVAQAMRRIRVGT